MTITHTHTERRFTVLTLKSESVEPHFAMFLCKQPGDTGIFATATPNRVAVYQVQGRISLPRCCPDSEGPETTAVPPMQPSPGSTANNARGLPSLRSMGDASLPSTPLGCPPSHKATSRQPAWSPWGVPLCPIGDYAIPDPTASITANNTMRQRRASTMTRSSVGVGTEADGAQPEYASLRPTLSEGPVVPVSLSLSCGRDPIHFFLADSTGATWIGRLGAPLLARLLTYPTTMIAGDRPLFHGGYGIREATSTASVSLPDNDAISENEGGDAALSPTSLRTDRLRSSVTASGWDPGNAAILALGRQDGVVQLLDVEYCLGGADSPLSAISTAGPPHHTIHPSLRARHAHLQDPNSTYASYMYCSTVQERKLCGPVTAMDWVPMSHLTVVAAQREDGLGFCAELLDLRSPESGVRYLGAPPGLLGVPFRSNGCRLNSDGYVLCYGECVACDPSQRFVATAGRQQNKDIVQLWDVRKTSRPLAQKVLVKGVGYTSLCWSPSESMTVIASTRSGGLRVHSYKTECGLSHDVGGEDSTSARRGGYINSYAATLPRSRDVRDRSISVRSSDVEADIEVPSSCSAGGGGAPLSVRHKTQSNSRSSCLASRVPAAAVAWVPASSDQHLLPTTLPPPPVSALAPGCCTTLPQLLLLNDQDGQLYTQVYNRRGGTVCLCSGEVPIATAGPNLFQLAYDRQYRSDAWSVRERLLAAAEQLNLGGAAMTVPPLTAERLKLAVNGPHLHLHRQERAMSSTSNESDLDAFNTLDVERVGSSEHNGEATPGTAPTVDDTSGIGEDAMQKCTTAVGDPVHGLLCFRLGEDQLLHTQLRVITRLHAGFAANPLVNLRVLEEEGVDRDAYMLFRYGYLTSVALFGKEGVVPLTCHTPGMLDLLMNEQQRRDDLGLTEVPLPASPHADGAVPGGGDTEKEPPQPSPLRSAPNTVSPLLNTSGNSRHSQGNPTAPFSRGSNSTTANTAQFPHTALGTIRNLVLQAMGWLPWSRPRGRGAAEDRAKDALIEALPFFVEGDTVGLSSLQEVIERRVAVLTLLQRSDEAATLLSHFSECHPLYPTIALELSASSKPSHLNSAALSPSSVRQRTVGCTYWLSLALTHVEQVTLQVRRVLHATQQPPEPRAWLMEYLDVPTQLSYARSLLRQYPRLPLPDVLGLATALLLPPQHTSAHLSNLAEVLQELVHQQYRYAYPTKSHEPTSTPAAERVPREARRVSQLFLNNSSGRPTELWGELLRMFSQSSLLLTAAVEGIGRKGVEMAMQRYVDETADVQGPLCYAAAFGSTRSTVFRSWRDAFRGQLNDKGHSLLRGLHDLQFIKTVKARAAVGVTGSSEGLRPPPFPGMGGLPEMPMSLKRPLVAPSFVPTDRLGIPQASRLSSGVPTPAAGLTMDAHRLVELRCNCGQAMHATAPTRGAAAATALISGSHPSRKLLPMVPCGNLECRQRQTPMCTVCGERMESRSMELSPERSFAWCTVCLHGGHWGHLRSWFAKHGKCPVEDCPCRCCEGECF